MQFNTELKTPNEKRKVKCKRIHQQSEKSVLISGTEESSVLFDSRNCCQGTICCQMAWYTSQNLASNLWHRFQKLIFGFFIMEISLSCHMMNYGSRLWIFNVRSHVVL